jgi:lipopolysaccharide assembly outer membrane protein LptD (OstA)
MPHLSIKKHINRKNICFFILLALSHIWAFAQEEAVLQDTITLTVKDTASLILQPADSIPVLPEKKSAIDAEITYQAADSIVFFVNGKAFLYGSGQVNYKEIELQADFIEIDMDSTQVFATGVKDSVGDIVGNPVFKEGSESYESRSMKYNFNTKKGFIRHVVTQQGEGYIVGEQTKKREDDMLFMKDGLYTTCSDHEHPHFYLNLTKAKVKPNSWVVSGPAYIVMEDIPLPLAVPFAYFPFTDSYSSGILMPSFGEEMTQGFFLRDGGYYFALSDYFDLALTGDIYTKGSWAVRGNSSYVKRYKFRGNLSANFIWTKTGELEGIDLVKSHSFNIAWMHSQDPKANLYRTLSANVNFSTNGYERKNIADYYDPNISSTNNVMSTVTFAQSFPDSPWKLQMQLAATQNNRESTVDLQLPRLDITMSRIYPLKRKNAVGKERWYEKIYLSYTGNFENKIRTKEDMLTKYKFPRDWNNGYSQSIPIAASFTLFKYLTITPSINYKDRFYFSQIEKKWDFENQNEIVADTISGFRWLPEYSGSVGINTKIYAFFKPLPAIFGEKINMIRWVMTPNVSFSARPGFGKDWKYYERTYVDNTIDTVFYSPYEQGIFGVRDRGKSGSLNFSLSNNLEMKVKAKNDSINPFKKISLIDNFSISTSYNLLADSFKLGEFSTNLRLKLTDRFTINLSALFDPYKYELEQDRGVKHAVKINEYKMPQMRGTGTSFGYSINNNTFRRKDKEKGKEAPEPIEFDELTPATPTLTVEESTSLLNKPKEKQNLDDEGYMKFEMPWSISFDYTFSYNRDLNDYEIKDDKLKFNYKYRHDISIRATLALTSKWNFSGDLYYDITENEINNLTIRFTRNLHCWSMTGQIVPIGWYKSYMLTISVNSQMLRDLKYDQRSKSSTSVW